MPILYPQLEKRWAPKGSTVWIYSDPHFNDPESIYFRGESYPGDDEQVKRINSKVSPNDTIIFLGDIGDIEFVKKIKGYKILITGNHDKGCSYYQRHCEAREIRVEDYLDKYGAGAELDPHEEIKKARGKALKELSQLKDFKSLSHKYYTDYDSKSNFWILTIDNCLFDEVYDGPVMVNSRLLLSHEPVAVPEYMFNIHGHTHGLPLYYYKNIGGKLKKKKKRYVNVCAEAINYTPVNLIKMVKEGLLSDIPSIHRITVDRASQRKLSKYKLKKFFSRLFRRKHK